MSAAFTPGPWQAEDPFDFEMSVVAHGDKAPGEWTFVAGCKLPDEDDHDITSREVFANARLIAAAPELYEALRSAPSLPSTFDQFERFAGEYRAFREQRTAALAKARGEQ